MYIAKFVCSNCNSTNKQEILLQKQSNSISCSVCKSSVMTVAKVNGCFVVISNKIGLVQIIYSPLDFKGSIKEFNRQFKRKSKFKIEAIFISKNTKTELANIKKNRKLNKVKALTKKTYYKIEVSEAIGIIEHVFKRKPEWVYNQDYKTPFLPGLKP